LTRRFHKIRKQGKKIARLDARRRHKLRIQAKKVRYALEFFADLFPGKKASRRRAKFLSALERVQDCLGDLNDIAVHEDRITAIVNRRGPRSGRPGSSKRAFAAGLLTGREDARLDTVVASASEHMRPWSRSSRSGAESAGLRWPGCAASRVAHPAAARGPRAATRPPLRRTG
jgi:hypothetical protein